MKHKLALVFALAIFSAPALAGSDPEPRKYAVLSLIGDSVTVVFRQPVTGTSLDKNVREVVPITDESFDRAALVAANGAIRKSDPSASIALFAMPVVASSPSASKLLEGDRFAPPDDMRATLAKDGATHLLLLTKLRAPARLKVQGGTVGNGTIEGLGYYIDRTLGMKRSDTGETGKGFLAPYAYFTISLIDLRTSSVVKHHDVTASAVFAASRNLTGFDPWNALSATEKAEQLDGFIGEGISAAVPEMLQR